VALIRKHLFDAIFEAELARKPAERGDLMLAAISTKAHIELLKVDRWAVATLTRF
jgi:hypothetical protein